MTRRCVWRAAIAVLLALASACDGLSLPDATPSVLSARTVLWPDSAVVGDSVWLEVRVRDEAGRSLAAASVLWSSPDRRTILETDPSGLRARAVFDGAGIARIRVDVLPAAGYEPVTLVDSVRVRQAWTAVDVGDAHTCAVAANGLLHCWGSADDGLLGGRAAADSAAPVPVVSFGQPFELAAGGVHQCGLNAGPRIYCWGNNRAGQLGNGSTAPTPVLHGSLRPLSLAAGLAHTCAVRESGEVACWGDDAYGQAGGTGVAGACGAAASPCALSPSIVGGLPSMDRVSAGDAHTCAVATAQQVYCWGEGRQGQLGAGAVGTQAAPRAVAAGTLLAEVSAGGRHTCALTPGGTAFCWGADDNGQLGTEAAASDCAGTPCATRPATVGGGILFRSISAGAAHTCGVGTDGRAYCWGSNDAGQLGIGTGGERCGATDCATTPRPVGRGRFRSIAAGRSHTCAIAEDGRLYCWGRNSRGQLGNGTRINSPVPSAVRDDRT